MAWHRLVELYSPLIYAWCRRSGLDGEDSRDTLQEILAAVAANIGHFQRPEAGGTFRGWVRVISRNQIALCYRRKARQFQAVGGSAAHLRLQELPENLPGDGESQREETSGLLQRGLELIRNEFEPRTWQAFWLTAIDQCPSGEVSARLQMTPGAVRQAKYKVLRRLRNELADIVE